MISPNESPFKRPFSGGIKRKGHPSLREGCPFDSNRA